MDLKRLVLLAEFVVWVLIPETPVLRSQFFDLVLSLVGGNLGFLL